VPVLRASALSYTQIQAVAAISSDNEWAGFLAAGERDRQRHETTENDPITPPLVYHLVYYWPAAESAPFARREDPTFLPFDNSTNADVLSADSLNRQEAMLSKILLRQCGAPLSI